MDGPQHDNKLHWLFVAAHMIHSEAFNRKNKKALKLAKEFCKAVDAEYLT